MREQFIGKTFWIVLISAAIAHLISFFVLHTPVEGVIVFVALAIVFGLTLWKLELGLLIAFAELFIGSHGHLFSYEWVSIRMVIFVAVMLAWLVLLMNRKISVNFKDVKLYPFYFLAFAVLIGIVVALSRQNAVLDIFNDANAYLFAGYILPMLSIEWTALRRRQLLQVLAAGASFITLETLGLLYIFSHAGEDLEKVLYTFFRDARIAELTRVSGNIFRVFIQSQLTVVVGFLLMMSALYFVWQKKENRNFIGLSLIASIAVIIISLSRSFWVGTLVGALVIFALVFVTFRIKVRTIAKRCLFLVVATLTGGILLWNLLAFPFPTAMDVGGFGSLISDRATELDEAAARSRWNLVKPMMKQIQKSPVVGSGFGTIVEYKSDDPRIQELQGGIATTYSFEWGYLDIWLKMGFLGIVAFLWIFVFYLMALWNAARDEKSHWLSVGLIGALVALFTTHIFSPYLNHPIGLGFLVFLLPFLKTRPPKLSLEALREKLEPKPVIESTPAMTSKVLE